MTDYSAKMSATEQATLGGGCFWCLEACYQDLKGVVKVESGYANGHVLNPTYKQVCEGDTGHAEVVQVTFEPAIVSFKDILEVFFTIHDPTTKDRQGNDVGTQYRSLIAYHTEEQKRTAEAVIQEVTARGVYDKPIVTEVQPLKVYYPAEAYHQNYYKSNPTQGYCQFVVNPKVAKFRKTFLSKLSK